MPVKISELPAASALGGTEKVPAVQSSVTVYALVSQIGTYVRGLFTTTPATIAEGGTGAATAAGARTNLDVPSNAEAMLDTLLTTTGDGIIASAASTPARIAAAVSVAAHATTCNPWSAREITLSGGAVTFTALTAAPYAGAVAWVYQNAAHTWTNGATFVVQGGADYVAAAGDWIRLYATTTSTFQVSVFKVSGAPVSQSPITNSLSGDVALNNTANYFTGPTIAQGTSGTWFASGAVTVYDTAGAAGFDVKLWDGTTVIASAKVVSGGASLEAVVALSGYIAAPAGNIRISVKDLSATTGVIRFNSSGESKDSTVSAVRIA